MRILGRFLLVVAGAGLVTGVLAPAAPASSPRPGEDGSAGRRLVLGPCQDESLAAAGAECGTVTVPLDHRRPGGATVEVAVSRLRAHHPEARRGVLRLTGSRLVTADVRAHGVYGRATEGRPPVPCVDRAVNAYLAGGALPDRDTSCA